jgi:hypothetical protein
VLFEAARPILLNGIEDVISRPDLGDRAIFLTLAPIAEADRRSEEGRAGNRIITMRTSLENIVGTVSNDSTNAKSQSVATPI